MEKENKTKSKIEENKKETDRNIKKLETSGKKMFVEIKSRNRYYYIFYRYSILFFTISFLSFIISLLFLIFFINQNVPPRYVPTDNQMRYFSVSPLSHFDKSDSEVQTFVMTTLKDVFSYDYINYSAQIDKSQDKFTSHGWVKFIKSMKKSFILVNAKENRWISSYRTKIVPKIIKKDIDSKTGIAYWLVEARGSIIYTGENDRTDNVLIKLRINRVSTLEKESGIGIETIIITIE